VAYDRYELTANPRSLFRYTYLQGIVDSMSFAHPEGIVQTILVRAHPAGYRATTLDLSDTQRVGL
jgi:hypothetical protein